MANDHWFVLLVFLNSTKASCSSAYLANCLQKLNFTFLENVCYFASLASVFSCDLYQFHFNLDSARLHFFNVLSISYRILKNITGYAPNILSFKMEKSLRFLGCFAWAIFLFFYFFCLVFVVFNPQIHSSLKIAL